MTEQVSMGGEQWDRGHRHLEVEKVENGFVVKARFFRRRRSGQGEYDSSEMRQHVFSDDAQMLSFVDDYFSGKVAGALKE